MTRSTYLLAVLAFPQNFADDLLIVPSSVHVGRVPDRATLSGHTAVSHRMAAIADLDAGPPFR